jgi:FG-GAP repeat protein
MLTFFTSVLLTAPVFAQSVGGDSVTLFEFQGVPNTETFGVKVAPAGDVNADGYPDFIANAQATPAAGQPRVGSVLVYSGMDGALLYQWDGDYVLYHGTYGEAISAAGDLNGDGFDDLLVGASYASPGGMVYAGSAFAYSGADGSLLYQWDGETKADQFGYSVADVGDINHDGFADIIIGAVSAQFGAGSAYLYSGADGSLLTQWDGTSNDGFGFAVAQAGDVNNDGFEDLIVGIPYAYSPNNRPQAGSAVVLSGADYTEIYRFDGRRGGNYFGSTVAGAGDVNQDGFADLIVGATGTDIGTRINAGSTFVYSGADGTLLYRWNGAAEADSFGWSVTGPGDVNRDGYSDLLVGARHASPTFPGAAYLYSGLNGTLLHQWQGDSQDDGFGISVSSAGDVDRDGFPDLMVGAPYTNSDRGSVYVFSFEPFLRGSTHAISATAGGMLNLYLDFPTTASFDQYRVLISKSGTGPIHYGIDIPLTLDSLLIDTIYGNYPFATYNDLRGTLDPNGDASASLTLPAGLNSALVGMTFHLAAVANPTAQLPEYSSVALPLTITP